MKQNIYDKRNENNKTSKETKNQKKKKYLSLNQKHQTLSKLLINHT